MYSESHEQARVACFLDLPSRLQFLIDKLNRSWGTPGKETRREGAG